MPAPAGARTWPSASEAAARWAAPPATVGFTTTSLRINFVRPVPGTWPPDFETHVVHRGRTVEVVDVVGSSADVPRTLTRITRQAPG